MKGRHSWSGKILKEEYDFKPDKLFTLREGNTTRGNNMKLFKPRARPNKRFIYTESDQQLELSTRQYNQCECHHLKESLINSRKIRMYYITSVHNLQPGERIIIIMKTRSQRWRLAFLQKVIFGMVWKSCFFCLFFFTNIPGL